MKKEPKYCKKCGCLLVKSVYRTNFDIHTGAKIISYVWTCPKRPIIFGYASGHTKVTEFGDDPDEPLPY